MPTVLLSQAITINRICPLDPSLWRLKFTRKCMDELENFHFKGSSDDSSAVSSDFASLSAGHSREKENLNELDSYRRGETEWYGVLGKFPG